MIKMFPFILIFKADDANSHKSNGVPRLEVFVFFLFFIFILFPVMFFKQIRSLLFVLNVLSG